MTSTPKREFDIDVAVTRIADAVQPIPRAALFELAEDGFSTPFELLVACVISIRTRDEMTLPIARRLFERARAPDEMGELEVDEIARLIAGAAFSEPKAA
ncbi:MAG TPA: hypothetical protein VMM78_06155 [Thermomicrobiales bacterium]|nr:hypothetical protein [Thermomicrobiales bacterium]